MRIGEKAVQTHSQGYNCAQCVLKSCSEHTGLDDRTATAVSAGFGGGVRSGEICGAISGAVMAIGLWADKNEIPTKETAELTKKIVDSFKGKYAAVRCLDLKEKGTSCDGLIDFGATVVEHLTTDK